MAKAPDWYKPLTALQKRDLLDLFAQATGVELHEPPAGRDDPGGWLCQFHSAAAPHVANMEAAMHGYSGTARDERAKNFCYDSRQPPPRR